MAPSGGNLHRRTQTAGVLHRNATVHAARRVVPRKLESAPPDFGRRREGRLGTVEWPIEADVPRPNLTQYRMLSGSAQIVALRPDADIRVRGGDAGDQPSATVGAEELGGQRERTDHRF